MSLMSIEENLIRMTKEERASYFNENFFKDLKTLIKSVANDSPFYKKLCEKAGYDFEQDLNLSKLAAVPYLHTKNYKENQGVFPQLTRVPENRIKYRTISTATSGNPSIVARTELDIKFLQTMTVDAYKDFLHWDECTYLFNFVPSRFMLNKVATRTTKQPKAASFVYFFNQPWESHCNNTYMIQYPFFRNMYNQFRHLFRVESVFELKTKKLAETIKNRKEDDFIVLGGNTILIYNVAEKIFREKGITFDLGNKGAVGTGGGGWDGVKGSIKGQPMTKQDMVDKLKEVYGIPAENIGDIYSFTESSALFPGHYSKKHQDQILHTMPFVKIIVRDPETGEPVKVGETGTLEVLSPYGINGFSSVAIMVDDFVQLLGDNDSTCPECGYKGAYFIHKGRQNPPLGTSCSSVLDFFERMH